MASHSLIHKSTCTPMGGCCHAHWEQFRCQRLIQGYFDMGRVGGGIWTANPLSSLDKPLSSPFHGLYTSSFLGSVFPTLPAFTDQLCNVYIKAAQINKLSLFVPHLCTNTQENQFSGHDVFWFLFNRLLFFSITYILIMHCFCNCLHIRKRKLSRQLQQTLDETKLLLGWRSCPAEAHPATDPRWCRNASQIVDIPGRNVTH